MSLVDVVGDHGVAICSNGAFTYDVKRRTVLADRHLDANVVREIVADIRTRIPGVGFAVQRADGFAREGHYANLRGDPPAKPIGPVEGLLDPRPGKLLARAPEMDDDEFLDLTTTVIGGRAIVAFSGAGGLAEISAAGVTKAAVLADWCEDREVAAEDICAFGDMPNDLPMLLWAGTSYAVANGHPDVITAATHLAPANDDDGVAQILESMVASLSTGRLSSPT